MANIGNTLEGGVVHTLPEGILRCEGIRVAIWRAWEREPMSVGACEQEKM